MNKIMSNENMQGISAYIDNVTICEKNREGGDKNLKLFITSNKILQSYAELRKTFLDVKI